MGGCSWSGGSVAARWPARRIARRRTGWPKPRPGPRRGGRGLKIDGWRRLHSRSRGRGYRGIGAERQGRTPRAPPGAPSPWKIARRSTHASAVAGWTFDLGLDSRRLQGSNRTCFVIIHIGIYLRLPVLSRTFRGGLRGCSRNARPDVWTVVLDVAYRPPAWTRPGPAPSCSDPLQSYQSRSPSCHTQPNVGYSPH